MEQKPLMGYYVTHRALRKDTERLKAISRNFANYSRDDWKRLGAWFNYHAKLVYYHHHGEDEYFFPWIKERSAKFSLQLKQMDDEHKSLDKFMDKMEKAFLQLQSGEGITIDEFTITSVAYSNLLVKHLDGEEGFVQEALKDFKTEEILAAEAGYLKQMPGEQRQLSLPWMVDVMQPEEKKAFFSRTPFFVKWIYRFSAKPKYKKLVSAIG